LGVKRDVTADTMENRLLRSFAKLLVCRGNNRLSFARAYDQAASDQARVSQLADVVRLCDERMRRSDLADVPTLTRLQPNNVLLRDPLYSRVHRAWKWLRDEEESLRNSWPDVLRHARILLGWMVASRVAACERVVVAETVGRVFAGRGEKAFVGVELLGAESESAAWSPNPPIHFLILPVGDDDPALQVRLSIEDEFIVAHVATLTGQGVLHEESVTALAFEVRAAPERLAAKRGVGIVVEGLKTSSRGAAHGYADIAGLALIAEQMANQILRACRVNSDTESSGRVLVSAVAQDTRLGIDVGSTSLQVSAELPIQVTTAAWTLALALPGEMQSFEWLDGQVEREVTVGAPARQFWTTGDVFEAANDADAGMLALAANRVLGTLALELEVPVDARVA